MRTSPLRVTAGFAAIVVAGATILYFRPDPPAPPPPAAAYPAPASQFPVQSAYDGDTFRILRADGSSSSVRPLGIDAPEMTAAQDAPPEDQGRPQCYATEARDQTRTLVLGRSVQLSRDPGQPEQDGWGRELAYVQLPDGRDLGEVLLEGGYVRVFNRYPVQRTAHYLELQASARAAGRGGWSVCGWTEAGR